MPSTPEFEKAYTGLNSAQKKAVDTVEGPVLVIAGPGTGKTHVLTLRIANILKQTQANPTNILVLTFTESAARTVRERLRTLVGEATARDVAIFTFHSFCDHVLKTYPDFFPSWFDKRLAGDVESALLWREVLESESVVQLRPPKSPFFYLRDLESIYKDLARERVTLEQYRAWAAEEEERIKADEGNYYTRDSKYGKKGDFKPDGQKKLERLEKVYEAITLFEAYDAKKERAGLYDFSDVLRGVVDTLLADEALRQTLQEQFQYLLADEHQDANAYQHALLDSFAYDEHPNLFVVGDEKQAIFRFQGADSTHFREFLVRYPRTALVTLTDSFRSLQGVLNLAHEAALGHIPAAHGAHEALTATRAGEAKLALLAAPDPLAERDQVAGLVEKAIAEGTAPHAIAVISSRNATVSLFAEHLAARGVPTLRAGDISLTSRPLVRSVLALMRAVADPTDTSALREVVLAPWWEAGLSERAAFLTRTRDHELLAELRVQFPKIGEVVSKLQTDALKEPPLAVFSRLLADSGARAFLLSHGEHLEDMLLVRRVYGYLEEVVVRDPNMRYQDAVTALTRAHEHGLEWVKSSALVKEGRVTVITAHKAKGMEFERVFIVGLTENEWENGKMPSRIPSPIDMTKSAEDAAKQFYVALTRAKDAVVFSYAVESLEGRERKPSIFIPKGLPLITPAYDPLPLAHSDVDAPALVTSLTRDYLMGEGLSPSALADYLKSPSLFFAKRVLHLKEPEQASMLIGNAVHAGIAAFIGEGGSEDRAFAALATALMRSTMPRTAAYDTAANDARARLQAFIKERAQFGTAKEVEKAYRTAFASSEQVNLYGKVDAVLERDGRRTIVDFKTSSQVKEDDPQYALQLAFYDYLLRENNEPAQGASLVQVRPDGVTEVPILITDESRAAFMDTLRSALEEMLSGKWREAAEATEYDDLLKLFTA